jgi:hypothetical protein
LEFFLNTEPAEHMRNERQELKAWTLGLMAAGLVTLPCGLRAEETQSPVLTTLASTTLSGYIDTSAILKFNGSDGTVGRSFDGDAKQNGFNLNVIKLQLEKPLEEAQWSAGYRVGLLFGPDANTLASTSTGLLDADSDFAIKNAYVALRAPVGNGLDFKVGVFDTIIGYEVMEAGNNPNYSRSFGFYLEPIIHTGVLASYQVCDVVSVSAGVVDPNNVLVNPSTINARSTVDSLFSYMGSITVTAPEDAGFLQGASLTAGVVDHGVAGEPDIIQYYVGGSMPTPLAGVTLGLAYDYRGNDEGDGTGSRYGNALAGYVVWQATEKLKLAGRAEYASGSAGTFGALYPSDPGKGQQLFGLTTTLDYSLWANAITRLEFRWDHDLRDEGIFNGSADMDCLSLALNVIYNF